MRYIQHVCTFAAKGCALRLLLSPTGQVLWPTFPPGVGNPERVPDVVIAAVSVA